MSEVANLYTKAMNLFLGHCLKRTEVYSNSGSSVGKLKLSEEHYAHLKATTEDTAKMLADLSKSETLSELVIGKQMYASVRSLDRALKMRSMTRADYWDAALSTSKNDSTYYGAVIDYRLSRYNEMVNRDSIPEGEESHLDQGFVVDSETGEVKESLA